MALFEEDKKLITIMIAMRVMESESFIEKNLFEFLLGGQTQQLYRKRSKKLLGSLV